MASLFEAAGVEGAVPRPLADKLRPQSLDEVAGQDHLLGEDGKLTRLLESGHLANVIFWGPAGSGKTTVARLLAEETDLHFEQLSAIFSGVQDLRKLFDAAKARRRDGFGTLLFIDEIHRFNRSQQDSFLPHMEDGTIILIGATTENPSFELNSALLSRTTVLTFNRLDDVALEQLLGKAEAYMGHELLLSEGARKALLNMADGDGRALLNLAEDLLTDQSLSGQLIDSEKLSQLVQRRAPNYDKSRDGHYNLISALHKSVRGSDPDAALYWFARMLAGGEDPLYIARRVVRMAVEDIGLAEPNGLTQAVAAKEAYEFLGSPEGELAIAQAIVYLATAPKSNAAYVAFKEAINEAREKGSLGPPKHILNAPTNLMGKQGYGEGYIYDHDAPDAYSGQDFLPAEMEGCAFYRPVERGFERKIQKRLDYWRALKNKRNSSG